MNSAGLWWSKHHTDDISVVMTDFGNFVSFAICESFNQSSVCLYRNRLELKAFRILSKVVHFLPDLAFYKALFCQFIRHAGIT